ncbi:MAG TPA: hypothetical protein VK892_16675 [Pyrinomonadaceae bacterium]|nr:hypothetical protein [Pyrinomonadaceae bacterium]
MRNAELAGIYSKIAKRSNAIEILLSIETGEAISRSRGVGTSSTESSLKSQTDLQRILVIQNQRIIELLQQLLKKK